MLAGLRSVTDLARDLQRFVEGNHALLDNGPPALNPSPVPSPDSWDRRRATADVGVV